MEGGGSIESVSAEAARLEMVFQRGERLAVWNPAGLTLWGAARDVPDFGPGRLVRVFAIGKASRVRWQWHYYGRPKQPENLCYEDHIVTGSGVSWRTNYPDPTVTSHPDPTYPAVEYFVFETMLAGRAQG